MARRNKFRLIDGETLLKQMRPHWMVIIPQTLILIVCTVILIIAMVWVSNTFSDDPKTVTITNWILVGLYLFTTVFLTAKKYVWWLTTKYIFTNKRVITRSGLLIIKGDTVAFNRIQSIKFQKTFLDRIFGSGELLVDSASETDIHIKYVRQAEEIQQEIYDQIHKNENPYNPSFPSRENNTGGLQ